MTGQRVSQALARIEAATARIAAAAAHGGSGDAVLSARHDALREAVTHSLRELDSLIDGASQ